MDGQYTEVEGFGLEVVEGVVALEGRAVAVEDLEVEAAIGCCLSKSRIIMVSVFLPVVGKDVYCGADSSAGSDDGGHRKDAAMVGAAVAGEQLLALDEVKGGVIAGRVEEVLEGAVGMSLIRQSILDLPLRCALMLLGEVDYGPSLCTLHSHDSLMASLGITRAHQMMISAYSSS